MDKPQTTTFDGDAIRESLLAQMAELIPQAESAMGEEGSNDGEHAVLAAMTDLLRQATTEGTTVSFVHVVLRRSDTGDVEVEGVFTDFEVANAIRDAANEMDGDAYTTYVEEESLDPFGADGYLELRDREYDSWQQDAPGQVADLSSQTEGEQDREPYGDDETTDADVVDEIGGF